MDLNYNLGSTVRLYPYIYIYIYMCVCASKQAIFVRSHCFGNGVFCFFVWDADVSLLVTTACLLRCTLVENENDSDEDDDDVDDDVDDDDDNEKDGKEVAAELSSLLLLLLAQLLFPITARA
jgi:hypothetical protein